MPIVRGQWNNIVGSSGFLTYRQAVWKQLATTNLATLNGGRITTGLTVGEFRGGSGAYTNPFDGNESLGPWDTVRRRMMTLPSGGHGGWSTWEVNEVDLATGTWNPNGRPHDPYSSLVRMAVPCWTSSEALLGGGGTSCVDAIVLFDPNHLYDSLANIDPAFGKRAFPSPFHGSGINAIYMPTVQRMLLLPGFAGDWGGNGNGGFHEWDPNTKTWQSNWADYPGSSNPWKGGAGDFDWQSSVAVWDSTHNVAVIVSTGNTYTYDPTLALGSRTARQFPQVGTQSTNEQGGMLWDTKRQRAFYLSAFRAFTLDSVNSFPIVQTMRTVTGPVAALTGLSQFRVPGLVYDAQSDRYLLWVGGKTIYWIDPVTFASTAETPSGGSDPGTRAWGVFSDPAGVPINGGYTLGYDSTLDAYVAAPTSADYAGIAVFAPTRTAVPNLAFTDLATATRTGNGDTSKGLPAGVHGALVTVWGTNLGDSQGTSTLTVGGVTPSAIYYWGRAIPPFAPATLYNGYQSLQCIIFQVASTTPLGAQSIVATVGGLPSASLAITITNTGAIKFAAPGGGGAGTYASPFPGIFSLVASLGQGDVGYIMGNLTEPTGCQIPNTSTFTADCAVVAYPGSVVQVGDATHGAFSVPNSGSGPHMVYSKVKAFGTSSTQAMNIQSNSRLVGCVINAPNGFGSLGAVGMDVFQPANNLVVYGNEFTNCGLDGSDTQYHTLYISGRRGVASPTTETGRDIGWNYFHDNIAVRAINCFNGVSVPGTVNNAITGHLIHDNVIINQQCSAILLGDGVMGSNSVYNNVVIRAGQSSSGAVTGAQGLDIRCNDPTGTGTAPAPVIHVYQNSFYQCGQSGAPSDSSILAIRTPGITMDVHNNIFDQGTTGFPYFATGGTQFLPDGNPAHWSNNLWFGSSGVPSGDSNSLAQDPAFVSAASPFDLHLQSTSPAIARGAGLGTSLDLDGRQRSATAPDLGAYAFGGTVTPPPPSPPALTALVPQSCTPGSPTFTLAVFATASPGFLAGAQVFWDGQARATTLLTAQEVTITVPASDVVTTGAHNVTATNPGSAVSNTLIFNVVLAPATIDLAWSGRLRDRVGPNETLAPDGVFDGTFVGTLHGTGGRTITALSLVMKSPSNVTLGTWNTTPDGNMALGAAFSLDGVLLNNPDTSVNFTVGDGGQWIMFASPFPVASDTEFVAGNVATLTVTFVDSSTATASVTITATNPTLTLLTPNTMGLNNPAFTLILTGTNFIQGSTVLWNGNSRATTFISNTIVEATVLATDLLPPPHTAQVSVRNPDSQTSNALPFTSDFTRQTGTFVGTVM